MPIKRTFMMGSRMLGLAAMKASLNAPAEAMRKAISLESTTAVGIGKWNSTGLVRSHYDTQTPRPGPERTDHGESTITYRASARQ